MSSSNNNIKSNNSFELQAKADEWMDITPTEELLRAELARLQQAFEKCTTRLDSSRFENDLLRDRGTALETEASDLRNLLESTRFGLESTRNELATVQLSSGAENERLGASLRESTERQARTETELSETNNERASEASKQSAEIQRLNRELKSSRAETKQHKEAAIRFAEDLCQAREGHKSTKAALETTTNLLRSEEQKHAKTKETLGTVATLAENLKAEKTKLERILAREVSSRTDAESTNQALRKQLAGLRSQLSERTGDLEGSNKSVEVLQTELKDAEKVLKESSSEQTSLKAHMAAMESGRHELLERQSELQESLEELQEGLGAAGEELSSTRKGLDKAILERDTLRNQRKTYLQSSDNVARLEVKLAEQKKAFEDRLRDIHSILGLKFTTAVQSEVREIRKSAIQQFPRSLQVPLLRQEGVKSS